MQEDILGLKTEMETSHSVSMARSRLAGMLQSLMQEWGSSGEVKSGDGSRDG